MPFDLPPFPRGDTKKGLFVVQPKIPTGLTDCTIWWTAKEKYTDEFADAILSKKSDNPDEIEILDVGSDTKPAVFRVFITNADTAGFPDTPYNLIYDVQIETPSAEIATPILGAGFGTVPDITDVVEP